MVCDGMLVWARLGHAFPALAGLHLRALRPGTRRDDEAVLSGNDSRTASLRSVSAQQSLAHGDQIEPHPRTGAGMASLTIISAIFGVWLGLTFKVFILLPAAVLALATLAGSGAASEAGAVWMITLDLSVIAAMQAGYIGGSALFVAVAD